MPPKKKETTSSKKRTAVAAAAEKPCKCRGSAVCYMAVDQTSEANRMKALGFKIKKRTGEVKEKK